MSNKPLSIRFVFASIILFAIALAGLAASFGEIKFLRFFEVHAEKSIAVQPQNSREKSVATIGTCDTAGPIEIESSGGTTTPTAYATLKDSFDAINLGTHTGAINVEVCGNTTESATASLDASAVGTTSYTSITIRPVGGQRIIEGTIASAVIKLNGADNVTIDGRIGGMGTSRDLTVRNFATTSPTAAVWLSSGTVADSGSTNNVIRNLEIATGTDSSAAGANTAIGIIMSGTTISTLSNGVDNDNNQFIFNRIIKARNGIVTRGTTTNLSLNTVVSDNIIGPESFGSDQIGKTGILMQADMGGIVSRNIVQYVGCLDPQACTGSDRVGIGIGTETWSATDTGTLTSANYTVTNNIVHDVIEELTFSSVGIKLGTTQGGSATNNLVANNMIYNVRANGTAGDQACGIGIGGGNGDRIVFNSISITGDMDPGVSTVTTTFGNGIRIPGANGTNNANFTIQNNSIYMDASATTATIHFYPITLNSAAYSFGTGSLNYNNYYINAANPQLFTGGLSAASGVATTTEFLSLALWQAALTPPQDANSIQANPQYFSPTADLHIQQASPNVNTGLTIAGITDDIDAQVRPNGANPDIGADEFYPAPGTVQFSMATSTISETGGMLTVTVTRAGGGNGAASVMYATGGGTATAGGACGGAVDFVTTAGTLIWADLDAAPKTFDVPVCSDGVLEGSETFNVTLSSPTTVTLGTPSTTTSTITDAGTTFNGTYNVGTGNPITSLTNPGGLFQAINSGSVTGNLTINITSDLTGETGAILLNEFAGGFSVLIKPSGAARTISGTSGAGLLGFNGVDNLTIDGSLSGGSDRSLTVSNLITTVAGGGIYFASGTAGTQNNTVKNVNIYGAGATAGTLLGITFGGNTFGAAGTDNDNNRIENNDIRGTFYGIASLGASAANKNTGTVITRNVMSGTGTSGIGRIGIYVIFDDGVQITENNIASVTTANAADCIGIGAGAQALATTAVTPFDVTNALIARNYIGFVSNTTTNSSAGIVMSSGPTGTNTVVNNMVTGVIGNADATDIIVGIYVIPVAGATQNIYHNSVSMTGDRGTTANMFPSFALAISQDQPINVRNNALFNSQTRTGATGGGGESYAIGFDGPAANVNLLSNNNDLFVSGVLGQIGITGDLTTAAQTTTAGTGTNQTTLAAWQAATTEDAASISVDPLFTSLTDLHIPMTSPLVNAGADVMVTTDFDGQTRDAMRDIGADEFVVLVPGVLQFFNSNFPVNESSTATVLVTRTGGSDGAVSVNYATNGTGSATGGVACGGAVDYVTTSGTLNWANGDSATKSFSVTICNDSIDEPNEAAGLALSMPTGGATIGAISLSQIAIIDDDVAGSLSINDVTQLEGNAGTSTFAFTVSLSAAGAQSVTVNYQTADGTATAPSDYSAIGSTLLIFNPGETMKTVNVTVNGDTTIEANETFFVNLSMASNATISDGQGQGTITNDDAVSNFNVAISDARITEGNMGMANLTFNVTLTSAMTGNFGSTIATVQYATANGTATAGSDYTTTSGTLGFGAPGTITVNVPITGDTNKEANEFFFVNLSMPSMNTTITDNQGAGIIVDNDRPYVADFDRDLKADYSIFRPSELLWYVLQSSNSMQRIVAASPNGNVPVPGDYDGDGRTDHAIFDGSSGNWFILRSSDSSKQVVNWGTAGDKPVQGDYDGDGKADVAVFRPSTGTWWVIRSSDSGTYATSFGISSDKPVQGDYDGDAKTDIAVYRDGTWYILQSSTNMVSIQNWGNATDKPVSGDFDGDGRYDLAIYRNGEWWIFGSLNGTPRVVTFGLSTDIPAPADFDGDGTTDVAVFRPSVGDWFVLRSSDQSLTGVHWGVSGDVPIPSAYLPQ